MTSSKPEFSTHFEKLQFLEKLGFPTNPFNKYARNSSDVWAIHTNLDVERKKLNYQIDGLVVKVNNELIHHAAGVVGKTPRAHCALKFSPEEATSKLDRIIWQVGRTGKLTPVAEFAHVALAGTIVKRASVHNYKEVVDRKLHVKDTVVIRKAGDIIPEVVQVLENLRSKNAQEVTIPEHCPSCHTQLVISKSGVDLECPNTKDCPAQVVGRLSYFSQRSVANIVGLSEKQLEKFVALYSIRDIPDLYQLPFAAIRELPGFGEKSVENLQKAIEEARTLDDVRFFAGLSIEGVGNEVAKLILEKLYQKIDAQKE